MMTKLASLILVTGAVVMTACSGNAAPIQLPAERLPVEIEAVELLQLESYPVQVMLHVTGWLPNPCSRAEWSVTGPADRDGRIVVELYALPQSNEACIQVLAPFDVGIPLQPLPAGPLEIVLNGKVVVRQVEG
jgi:hypothetical protein